MILRFLAEPFCTYFYLRMDIVYSDHQGVREEPVSTLVHLHWYTSTMLTTQLCSGLGKQYSTHFKGDIMTVYRVTGGWCPTKCAAGLGHKCQCQSFVPVQFWLSFETGSTLQNNISLFGFVCGLKKQM